MAKTIREVYGEALVRYGKDDPRVVVLDADVSGSTRSCLFRDACPERFYNVGIAEANMTAMAAGFASVGKIPFVNTFAVFISSIGLVTARALGSYAGLGLKLVGAYGGMSDSFDGPSHHSVDDLAIMRALPGFQVYVASDPVLTDWMVRHAIEDPAPMYLRMSRDSMPGIYDEHTEFRPGKGIVLRDGEDATIFACGLMVHMALEAAKLLQEEGISVRVADLFSIKPIDRDLILESARKTGAVVTAEEHTVIGGLGGAVAEVLVQSGVGVPVRFAGLQDRHGTCGPYPMLLQEYGLDAAAIASKVREAVQAK